jgi:hypothetical protein
MRRDGLRAAPGAGREWITVRPIARKAAIHPLALASDLSEKCIPLFGPMLQPRGCA